MNKVSEYYKTWEEYKEENEDISQIEGAKKIQSYEEQMYTFIFQLFL